MPPTDESTLGADVRRPRVLLLAEACNPAWTSVPLVGYNWYEALRHHADVTLVTQVRNRDDLTRRLDEHHRVAFIDSEALARPFRGVGNLMRLRKGLGWTAKQAAMWVPYLYFEWLAYRRFRAAIAAGEFDLVHRVTPVTPTFPSPMARWVRLPFILGPINGGLPWPKGSTRTRLREMEWAGYFRGLYRLLPYVRSTYRRSASIIAASYNTLNALPAHARERAVYLPENGVDPARFHADGRTPPSRIGKFRILYLGRLVPLKQVDVLLRAVATSNLDRSRTELVIVGDGPQRGELEALATKLDIGDMVRFEGNQPHDSVPEYFRTSSVFAFPSLREFGGAVVMEALACGLPCIVVDFGGPGELITDATGRKLTVGAGEIHVRELRAHLEAMAGNSAQLDAMSQAAAAEARERYTWDAKARRVVQIYRQLMARS